MSLLDKIHERMEFDDHVSFVELVSACGPEAKGNLAIEIATNIAVWTGVSDAFASALEAAFADGTMHMHPSSTLVYLIDGGIPSLPIAQRPPKGGYKEPHWLPVTFKRGATSTCTATMCKRTAKRAKAKSA